MLPRNGGHYHITTHIEMSDDNKSELHFPGRAERLDSMGTESTFSGVEAEYSPSFSVEVKNEWSYTSIPP